MSLDVTVHCPANSHYRWEDPDPEEIVFNDNLSLMWILCAMPICVLLNDCWEAGILRYLISASTTHSIFFMSWCFLCVHICRSLPQWPERCNARLWSIKLRNCCMSMFLNPWHFIHLGGLWHFNWWLSPHPAFNKTWWQCNDGLTGIHMFVWWWLASSSSLLIWRSFPRSMLWTPCCCAMFSSTMCFRQEPCGVFSVHFATWRLFSSGSSVSLIFFIQMAISHSVPRTNQ